MNSLFHPTASVLAFRVAGLIAAGILLASLVVLELSPGRKRQLTYWIGPVIAISTVVFCYALVIVQRGVK